MSIITFFGEEVERGGFVSFLPAHLGSSRADHCIQHRIQIIQVSCGLGFVRALSATFSRLKWNSRNVLRNTYCD